MSKVEASVDRGPESWACPASLRPASPAGCASDLTVILAELDRLSEQERSVRGALLIDCSGGEK